jgi:uncharacterized membrane protein YcaP (DUF421 family)
LLLYKGELLNRPYETKREITIEEIYVAARKRGIAELKDIDAIVLETTGDITIIPGITVRQKPLAILRILNDRK